MFVPYASQIHHHTDIEFVNTCGLQVLNCQFSKFDYHHQLIIAVVFIYSGAFIAALPISGNFSRFNPAGIAQV